MMSTLVSSVHRLAPPPSVQIFVVSGPWLEPTGTVPFSGGSRKARSSSTAAQSYTISFHSCTLLFSSRSLYSSAPVNRLKPDEMLRQSHSYSQQHLFLTSAPEMASSVNVYLDCYSGESFCTIKGYISSPICLAAQTVHSDETSFSPAALFISSTRSLGGVQFGDPNPSNIIIWAWPIKGYKKKSFRSFYLPVDSSGQSTPLSSLSSFSQEMRAVLPHASVMRNVFPPNTKWRCVSLSIAVCSSCVAVRSGPEDATDIVSTIFRGADWILTSQYKVTKFQVSSTAVSLAPTHSSHDSSSLSFYLRGFSTFSLYALLLVVRVWLNSFLICSLNV
ncbi:BnaA09g02400D [Brassica napus]|uniref:BnaA09g02400D protein n=2 Tax=Brassica napus TaxID=3708 RepID=A0A078G3U6_BRANA|nr:BnaA09g02400D [Brassica napus]